MTGSTGTRTCPIQALLLQRRWLPCLQFAADRPMLEPMAADDGDRWAGEQYRHLRSRSPGDHDRYRPPVPGEILQQFNHPFQRPGLHGLNGKWGKRAVVVEAEQPVPCVENTRPEIRKALRSYEVAILGDYHSSIRSAPLCKVANIRVRYSRRWRVTRKFSSTNSLAFRPIASSLSRFLSR